jgi:hypothetical protein
MRFGFGMMDLCLIGSFGGRQFKGIYIAAVFEHYMLCLVHRHFFRLVADICQPGTGRDDGRKIKARWVKIFGLGIERNFCL